MFAVAIPSSSSRPATAPLTCTFFARRNEFLWVLCALGDLCVRAFSFFFRLWLRLRRAVQCSTFQSLTAGHRAISRVHFLTLVESYPCTKHRSNSHEITCL